MIRWQIQVASYKFFRVLIHKSWQNVDVESWNCVLSLRSHWDDRQSRQLSLATI